MTKKGKNGFSKDIRIWTNNRNLSKLMRQFRNKLIILYLGKLSKILINLKEFNRIDAIYY